MPNERVLSVKKYRVTIEELQNVEVTPTFEEQNSVASSKEWKKPERYVDVRWVQTDYIELSDKSVLAGFLKSKAEHLNPTEGNQQ